jgi:hypothetical protein
VGHGVGLRSASPSRRDNQMNHLFSFAIKLIQHKTRQKTALLFGVLFLSGSVGFAVPQTKSTLSSQETEKAVQRIDATVSTINRNRNGYRRITKQIQGGDGGGELMALQEGEAVRKLYLWIGNSNQNIITEYYFAANNVVLISQKQCHFKWDNAKEQFDYTQYGEIHSNQYYFQNGKIIRHRVQKSGSAKPQNKGLDAAKEQSLIQEANRVLKAALSKSNPLDRGNL